eukprot:5407078-Amphidinium_carterae.1
MRRATDLAETTGFLLRPTTDGQGVRAEVANYQDAVGNVGYTAAMLAGLKVVSDGGDAWQVGETVLLPTGATRYWTEHSP